MRIPRFLVVGLSVLLLVGTATPAIVLRVTVEELTEKATLIVRGEVLEAKAAWTADRSTINTLVRVRADEVLKGSATGDVTITCPGGKVGDDKVDIHGVPTFTVGEKVVVFLWKNKDGELLPLGLNQGKFRIEKDPETGGEVARNSLEGLAFATRSESERKRVAQRKPDVLPAADLTVRVRGRLALMEKRRREAAEAAEKPKVEKPSSEEDTSEKPTGEHSSAPAEEKPAVGEPADEKKAEKPAPEKKKPEEEAPPGRD